MQHICTWWRGRRGKRRMISDGDGMKLKRRVVGDGEGMRRLICWR